MDDIRTVIQNICRRAVDRSGLLLGDSHASLPVSRYMMSIPCCIPVEHVILAERPYYTNIFPYAASAMSYDPLLSDTTPAVHFMALGMRNDTNTSYDCARDWFRDSWKYLNKGVLVLNVCTVSNFMDNASERDRVSIEELLKEVISVSLIASKRRVHIYALGNPARHSATRIRSSISVHKNLVTIHECVNPASFKYKYGDTMSPDVTLDASATTRLLAKLISDTSQGQHLSELDYYKMTTEGTDLSRLAGASISMAQTFKEISAYFKSNTGKTVERNDELFERASEEVTQFVLAIQTARIKALFANVSEPKGTSKPAYFNSRTNYNANSYSRGSSSKTSVATPGKKQSLGFADEPSVQEETVEERSVPQVSATAAVGPSATLAGLRTPSKPPASIATHSMSGKRSISIGFADDEDDVAKPVPDTPTPAQRKASQKASIDTSISSDELEDLSYLSDFIDPSNERYVMKDGIVDAIQEAVRSHRASTDISKEAISVIRSTRSNPKQRTIMNALGYEDSVTDMPSDIMQWVLKYVVE